MTKLRAEEKDLFLGPQVGWDIHEVCANTTGRCGNQCGNIFVKNSHLSMENFAIAMIFHDFPEGN